MDYQKMKAALIGSLAVNVLLVAVLGHSYYRQTTGFSSTLGAKTEQKRLFFEELSLDRADSEEIKRSVKKFYKEAEQKHQEVIRERKRLVSLLRADFPDLKNIHDTLFIVGMREDELRGMVTTHMIDIVFMLDKENRQRYLNHIEKAILNGKQFGCPLVE